MKKLFFVLLAFPQVMLFAQNSYPSTGVTQLNSGTDQSLILKDGRTGTNWNYIEWQFSDATRDWILGRHVTTGNFTLWRNGIIEVFTATNVGNVGIGTTTPSARLDVSTSSNGGLKISGNTGSWTGADVEIVRANSTAGAGNGSSIQFSDPQTSSYNMIQSSVSGLQFSNYYGGGPWTERLRITPSGNVGIGTTSPLNGMNVYRYNDFNGGSIRFGHSGTNDAVASMGYNAATLRDALKFSYFPHNSTSGQVDLMTLDTNGNVGIGTTNPDYPLTVNGSVHAKEVRVDLNVPAPDYVFEKDYQLTSLEDIKNYIDQNKHLPEVPSAKEMGKDGVQLGEMNMILLKKIEELTLHVIELKKEIKDMKENNDQKK